MSTHRQSDGVGLFTSNGIVDYAPAGSRKVLNKPVVLCQALVIGQQTAWYPPGASRLPLLLNETRKCGKLNEGLPPAGQSPSGALARNKHQILVHTLRTILHRCMRRGVVTKKKSGSLSTVRCEKAFRNGTFKTKQYPIKIKIKIKSESR